MQIETLGGHVNAPFREICQQLGWCTVKNCVQASSFGSRDIGWQVIDEENIAWQNAHTLYRDFVDLALRLGDSRSKT